MFQEGIVILVPINALLVHQLHALNAIPVIIYHQGAVNLVLLNVMLVLVIQHVQTA